MTDKNDFPPNAEERADDKRGATAGVTATNSRRKFTKKALAAGPVLMTISGVSLVAKPRTAAASAASGTNPVGSP